MATVNLTTSEAQKGCEAGRSLTIRKRVSFVTNPTTTSDTMYIFKVAPYTIIDTFQVDLVTAEGATGGCDFGVIDTTPGTTDDNGLDDGVDLNGSPGAMTRGAFGTDAYIGKQFGAAGGYITADPDNDLDAAVADITVVLRRAQDH